MMIDSYTYIEDNFEKLKDAGNLGEAISFVKDNEHLLNCLAHIPYHTNFQRLEGNRHIDISDYNFETQLKLCFRLDFDCAYHQKTSLSEILYKNPQYELIINFEKYFEVVDIVSKEDILLLKQICDEFNDQKCELIKSLHNKIKFSTISYKKLCNTLCFFSFIPFIESKF